jgi:hypothetical protein
MPGNGVQPRIVVGGRAAVAAREALARDGLMVADQARVAFEPLLSG